MRIVAGEFRGRTIEAPKGTDTRPTTDRVRESLFSALAARLGADLDAARVLDAFAGSGALGLEALSRGAAHATFVESDRRALMALKANIAVLGVASRSRVVAADSFASARAGSTPNEPYSLILLDPPYRIEPTLVRDLLEALVAGSGVAEGAMVTWEHSSDVVPEWPEGFEVVSSKKYGTTSIDIAQWERGDQPR